MNPNTHKFDTAAPQWDNKVRRHTMAQNLFTALEQKISFHKDMHVLDFGCGTGLVTLQIAEKVARITGADTSGGMLEQLRQKADFASLTNVDTWKLETEERIPAKGSFDAIVTTMTLHHVQHIEALFQDLFLLLRPGGKIGLIDLDTENGHFHSDETALYHKGFNSEQLIQLLAKSGYINIEATTAAETTRPSSLTGEMTTFTMFLISAEHP